jgi:hypothetical protein
MEHQVPVTKADLEEEADDKRLAVHNRQITFAADRISAEADRITPLEGRMLKVERRLDIGR